MVRGTTSKTRPSGRQTTKTGAARSKAATGRATAVKAAKTAPTARRNSVQPVAAGAGSKDELRARIEKLERANATLRAKNKELRLAHVEAAEKVDELTLRLEAAERRAGRQMRSEAETGASRGRSAASGPRRRAGSESAAGDDQESDVMARSAEAMAL